MSTPRHNSLRWLLPGLLLGLTLACTLPPLAPPARTPTPSATSKTAPLPPTATPAPTVTPAVDIALYSVGSPERPQLYAVDSEGASSNRERVAHRGSAVSRRGRWLALPTTLDAHSGYASAIEVRDTDTGRAFTIDLTAGFWLFEMAFDPAETRLALLEMGWPEADYTPWAYIIVDLAEGSTRRFANSAAAADHLPGQPLGWTADSQMLLVNAFIPYSDAGMMGVYAYTFPPEMASRPITEVTQRLVLSAPDYREQRLSANGARMLYLNRTEGYMPTGYDPTEFMFDAAVNQLWVLDIDRDEREMWVEITDGGALHHVAAFSPDGTRVLFAAGDYVNNEFDTLTFQVHDGDRVTSIGPAPLAPGDWLIDVAWCHPDHALVLTWNAVRYRLHLIPLSTGEAVEIAAEDHIALLGCVYPDR